MVIIVVLLSILSAILYRAGGMDKTTKHWIPVWMRRSWVRDYLCPICALLPLIAHPSWWLLAVYGLSVAALSTYWDWLFKYDCYWFSGLMCGVAAFLLVFSGIAWWILVIRAAIIAITWGLICYYSEDDFVEEYSRGFFFSIPSLLFLI